MKRKSLIIIFIIFLLMGCSNMFWLPLGLTLGTYDSDNSGYSIHITIQWNGDVEIIRNEFQGSQFVSTTRSGKWKNTGSDTFIITIDGLDYACTIDTPSSFEMAGLMFYLDDYSY